MSVCDCGTTGCDPCVCGHPWSDHEGRPECLGDQGHCMCAKFDRKIKPHFVIPPRSA